MFSLTRPYNKVMDLFSTQGTRLHYDLKLELAPISQYVAISGSLVYHAPADQTDRARFYLHHQLSIRTLTGRRVLGYHLERVPEDPFPDFLADHAAQLDIYFDPPLSAGETALIQFEYYGNLTQWSEDSANIISPEWVEIGRPMAWYPLLYNGSPASLTYSLQATILPGRGVTSYQAASLGTSTDQSGIAYFNWPYLTDDIVLVASPDLCSRLFESEANRVRVHHTAVNDSMAQLAGEDLLWTLERLAGWFGPVRPEEFTLVVSPRAQGGNYACRGLVVLTGIHEHEYLDQQESHLSYLAHEAAHTWWWSAPSNSWHSWLNESFAEYSALMAVRERFGQAALNRRLEHKREMSAGISPLWQFDCQPSTNPDKQQAMEAQLYHQGPLLLHQLAERVSNRRFLDLCRSMQWAGVQDTVHFLELLEELEDKATRDWMEQAMKQQ